MNVLYTSQKLHELFCDEEDHPSIHANVSGNGDGVPGRCCRLCGGDNNLRYFGDTYVWDGIEERYDQLLDDCFGVKVTSPDCMICEWCVRALRTTDRFRTLVHAAFDHRIKGFSSSLTTLKSSRCMNNLPKSTESGKLSEKSSRKSIEIEEIPPKKPFELAKKREDKRKHLRVEAKVKRTNIPCDVCKQRYPMIVTGGYDKPFICSRCKKNNELRRSFCKKCNVMMPATLMNEHLQLHARAGTRSKTREDDRKRVQYQPCIMPKAKTPKYRCSQCPKKYALARHLQLHMRNAHGDSYDYNCTFCSLNMETREKLQEHLLEHSSLHQCDDCLLVFKNKKTLVSHSTKHHVSSNTS